MHKKHMFLRVFSKIAIFACVFCTLSAWADTTTCDIDFTPVTGNSWQNGTPTPTNPVEIKSIGTKVGNKYYLSVTTQGNLFDKDKENICIDGFVSSSGTFDGSRRYISKSKYSENKRMVSVIYPVEAGKTYVLNRGNFKTSAAYRLLFTKGLPTAENIVGTFIQTGTTPNAYTITIPEGATYVVCYVMHSGDDTYTIQDRLDSFMLVEGSTAPTSYEPYSAPITTTVYLDEPLRKVGNYADVLDYKNGTITRNVGVKVLDGTETWNRHIVSGRVWTDLTNKAHVSDIFCSHYKKGASATDSEPKPFIFSQSASNSIIIGDGVNAVDAETFKAYLAQQYANGTPVIVYYPLATSVVEQIENWSCPVPITDIKIATTKMVDDEFAVAEANLAATVQTIESVVSRTIAQTGQIATLQEEKQTRPDESCPANMKCLLVQDEDGTPHWYPIIEP